MHNQDQNLHDVSNRHSSDDTGIIHQGPTTSKTVVNAPAKEKPVILQELGPSGQALKKWRFPWHLCQKWKGMQDLIKQAYGDNPVAVQNVENCAFELLERTGCIIIPLLWESTIKPGMKITISFKNTPRYVPQNYMSSSPPPPPIPFGKPIRVRSNSASDDDSALLAETASEMSEDSRTAQSEDEHEPRLSQKPVSLYDNTVKCTVKFFTKPRTRNELPQYVSEEDYIGVIKFAQSGKNNEKIPILQEITHVQSPHRQTESGYYPEYGIMPPPKRLLSKRDRIKRNGGDKSLVLEPEEMILEKSLKVNSPLLLNVLRTVMKYSSELPSGGKDSLNDGTFKFPYIDLYQHKEELLEFKKSDPSRERHSDIENREYDNHIDVLIDYLNAQEEIQLLDFERRLDKDHPTVTFSTLWLLMKPGSDVYVREYGQFNAYILESISGGHKRRQRAKPYRFRIWNLTYDSQRRLISRDCRSITVPVFDGEREITSLPLFPIRFYRDEPGQDPLKDKLIQRGKRYVSLAQGPAFREYTGKGLESAVYTYDRERVIVNPGPLKGSLGLPPLPDDSYINDDDLIDDGYPPLLRNRYPHSPPPGRQNSASEKAGARARIPGCPCEKCEKYRLDNHIYVPLTYESYDNLNPEDTSLFSEHQYFLCESHVDAYILRDHIYDTLDVASVIEPWINVRAIDQLIMKTESTKSLLKAICKAYRAKGSDQPASFVDFIRGKGEGQVILLHGPPGTGKTLTAESVAEFTERPLLSITAADLGHDPPQLEKKLLGYFEDANRWGAIVLLDEADVYLERRSTEDLRRNSIVSIFLRALDYFKGILFLTTNRVGSFDEAFVSRIHVQIGYDSLDEEARRKIWDNFFRKLKEDHEHGGREIHYDWETKEYAQRSQEVRDLRWNGREIRNAFQTAVTLALDDVKDGGSPTIRESHLRQVVKMSQSFRDYMKSTHEDMDDSEMAYKSGLRDDSKKSHSG